MSTPYIGEIRLFAGSFAPVGWALCDGSILSIAEFDTLFTLIGTTYGGDGQNTFALPDLRGRVPLHRGTGAGLPTFQIGQLSGTESVTLSQQQLPQHSHLFLAATGGARETTPAGNLFAAGGPELFANGTLSASGALPGLPMAGSNLPHENMAPFLAVSFIISLFGIFPSQN